MFLVRGHVGYGYRLPSGHAHSRLTFRPGCVRSLEWPDEARSSWSVSQHLETSQRIPAFAVVVDDRGGIARGWSAVQGPGLVDGPRVDVAKLRHIPADVVPVRVEPSVLEGRVEDPEVRRRVGAAAGRPLPAVLVRGKVAVDQPPHEVPGTMAPLDVQVLDQEAGRDHPDPVVHPALGP